MRAPVFWILVSLVLHALVLLRCAPDTLAGGQPERPAEHSITLSLAEPPEQEAEPREPIAEPEPEPEPDPEPAPEQAERERLAEEIEPVEEPETEPEREPVSEPVEPPAEVEPVPAEPSAVASPEGPGADHEGDHDDRLNRYRGELRRAIERHREYPSQARLRGHEGTVTLRFRVSDQGRAEEVTVVDSSGSRLLDSATERLLYRLRLPEPPPDLDVGEITVPVNYSLNG